MNASMQPILAMQVLPVSILMAHSRVLAIVVIMEMEQTAQVST